MLNQQLQSVIDRGLTLGPICRSLVESKGN